MIVPPAAQLPGRARVGRGEVLTLPGPRTTALPPARDGIRRPPALQRSDGDERLVLQLRAGDERAFEVLFDRYRSRLLGFCRGMLRSNEDAEDVLQDVFVAAHAAILADEREIDVRPWLFTIARNRCLNHLRRRHPDCHGAIEHHPHRHGATAEEHAAEREDLRALVAGIRELPKGQRTALLLRELEALSYAEIASSMETSVSAVKSLLVRARAGLADAGHRARTALAPTGPLLWLKQLAGSKVVAGLAVATGLGLGGIAAEHRLWPAPADEAVAKSARPEPAATAPAALTAPAPGGEQRGGATPRAEVGGAGSAPRPAAAPSQTPSAAVSRELAGTRTEPEPTPTRDSSVDVAPVRPRDQLAPAPAPVRRRAPAPPPEPEPERSSDPSPDDRDSPLADPSPTQDRSIAGG